MKLVMEKEGRRRREGMCKQNRENADEGMEEEDYQCCGSLWKRYKAILLP
jgi:hypothetical protein